MAIDGRALDAGRVRDRRRVPDHPGRAGRLHAWRPRSRSTRTATRRWKGSTCPAGRFCTQCEAEGFRKITCFPTGPTCWRASRCGSRPTSAYPRLLSNGNLIEAGELPGGRHFAVWNDPFPKPCYLFALVAGELDVLEDSFVTMSGRKVDLRIYRRPRHGRRAPPTPWTA